MLCRELKACCEESGHHGPAHEALETARGECEALLARCPGEMDSTLCHRHLNGILEALQRAIDSLTKLPASPDATLWQSASRHLLHNWKRQP